MYVRVQVQILNRPTATGLTVEQVLADKILVFLRQVLSFLMRRDVPVPCAPSVQDACVCLEMLACGFLPGCGFLDTRKEGAGDDALCFLCSRSHMRPCAHNAGASALGRLYGKEARLGVHHVSPGACRPLVCMSNCI